MWYFTAGNWAEGLLLGTEDFANGARKRWTRTVWTQDDPTKSYQINPRIAESRVGDETNTKKTKIEYLLEPGSPTVSRFGLVSEVRSYDANQTTVLKKAVTEYNLNQIYLDRRIIGLPAESRLYEGENLLQSKTTYSYDEGVFSDANLQQNIAPIQHDNTNYGANFTVGRGNATSTTRHDVTGQTAPVTSSVKYNTAGAAVA